MKLTAAERQVLCEAVGEEGQQALRFDEPLSRHTTLRIGGPADAWAAPSSVAAVQRLRKACAELALPCQALGAGSNLLVRDGGVRGLVLSSERLRRLEFAPAEPDGTTTIYVEAGVATGKLLVEATKRHLGGVEFLGGVPGSIGGGLIMNAGTYLGEFKDVTTAVDGVSANGSLIQYPAAQCGFVYRGSALPHEVFIVAGHLRLAPRPRAEIEEAVRALRERRRAREPHGFPNAGSFFKNPPGDYAGRLLEAAGLKGRRIGDAEVATAHANWILNVGRARAADVLSLIALMRQTVFEQFGVSLELEVRVIGEEA